jgi:phospholipid-translocating ATPase
MWTNYKCLILETRYKTMIVAVSFAITTGGWWAWSGFLSAIYSNNLSPFDVKGGFQYGFGQDANWWATLIMALAVLAVAEAGYAAACKVLATWGLEIRLPGAPGGGPGEEVGDLQLWQEMEKDRVVGERLREMAGREGENFADEKEVDGDDDFGEVELGKGKGRWRGLKSRLHRT